MSKKFLHPITGKEIPQDVLQKMLEHSSRCITDLKQRWEQRYGSDGDLFITKSGNVIYRATGKNYEHK